MQYWLLFQDCSFNSGIKIRDRTRLKFKCCAQKEYKKMKRGDGIDESWTAKKSKKSEDYSEDTNKRKSNDLGK